MNTRKLALIGLLTTIALLATYIERLVPSPVPAIPGIKLGLANVVILSLLYLFDGKTAFYVNIARITLAALLFTGFSGFIYSLAGGLFSFTAMYFAKKLPIFSSIGVSVLGGTFHNVGQILVASLILQSKLLLYYLPVLVISGVVTGILIGYITIFLVQHLQVYCDKYTIN